MNPATPESTESCARSPLLMNPCDTAVVVIDVQQKLLPYIGDHEAICWNVGRIIEGARILGLNVFVTEQYPRGLGETAPAVVRRLQGLGEIQKFEKLMFSCRGCPELLQRLDRQTIGKILLVGIETHVCVMQSALDLMADGFDVYVAEDATGSRFDVDKRSAIRRLEISGATIVSTEMALFEWCMSAEVDGFKQISQIVREPLTGS